MKKIVFILMIILISGNVFAAASGSGDGDDSKDKLTRKVPENGAKRLTAADRSNAVKPPEAEEGDSDLGSQGTGATESLPGSQETDATELFIGSQGTASLLSATESMGRTGSE